MATITVNGVELYYERHGAGDPVILVHGAFGDADRWTLLAPELAQDHDVVAYDQRGHSRSERPAGSRNMDELVADLAALIETLGVAPSHIVGNSMGGAVVLRLACRSPELIKTLSVHEPATFELLAHNPSAKPLLERIVADRVDMAQKIAVDPLRAIDEFLEGVAPGLSAIIRDEERQRMADNATYSFGGGQRSADLDVRSLGVYQGPALLTKGDASPPYFGWNYILPLLEQAIPKARSVTLEGAGHLPEYTHATQYAELLRKFFAEVR